MKRVIHAETQESSMSTRYDYSNIIGIGHVDSKVRKYLSTLPDWISDNMIKFGVRNVPMGDHYVAYTLVVEPLDSDPDPRPIIFRAYNVSQLRKQIAEYEKTYVSEDRYTNTGYRALI